MNDALDALFNKLGGVVGRHDNGDQIFFIHYGDGFDWLTAGKMLEFFEYQSQVIAPKIHSQDPFGKAKESTISAIEELNERFQQHNIGYEFVDGTLVRIDNIQIDRYFSL